MCMPNTWTSVCVKKNPKRKQNIVDACEKQNKTQKETTKKIWTNCKKKNVKKIKCKKNRVKVHGKSRLHLSHIRNVPVSSPTKFCITTVKLSTHVCTTYICMCVCVVSAVWHCSIKEFYKYFAKDFGIFKRRYFLNIFWFWWFPNFIVEPCKITIQIDLFCHLYYRLYHSRSVCTDILPFWFF